MRLVLDASVAACWAFADEDHPIATLTLERLRTEEANAPSLWWFELRNTLIVSERRKRLTEKDSNHFLHDLTKLGVQLDHSPIDADVLRLARTHHLSVYDASYLELALRRACPLATLDKALRKAAKSAGVALIE
jgi:predicted nucleic acid-binding protein